MKKSVLGIILCLCILAGLLPGNTIAAAATPTGGTWGGIDWSLDSDGTLTIAPTKGTPVADASGKWTYEVGQWREAVIYNKSGGAANIGGWPYDRTAVKKLVIEEGVTYIGSFAAQSMTNLTGEVVIPSTVTYIGQEAFQKSTMEKLTFAKGGSKELCIAQGAFKNLIVEEIVLPGDRPVHLHDWMFLNSAKLQHIFFPASLTGISGTHHVDYNHNPNAQTGGTLGGSSIFNTTNSALKKLTFGSEAARDMFIAKKYDLSKYEVIVIVKVESLADPEVQNTITYGEKLSAAALPDGWAWADGDVVPAAGKSSHAVYYTPEDTARYDWSDIDGWNDAEKRVERTATVSVMPKNIVVSMVDCEIYAGEEPEYTYTVEGLAAGDMLIRDPGFVIPSDYKTPGVYTVYIDGAYAGPNYTVTHVEGQVTVKAVPEAPKPTYSVSIGNTVNGSAAASKKSAYAGDTVTLTLSPGSGYTFGELRVAAGSGAVAVTKVSENAYTFKMPAADVSVTATFVKLVPPADECNGSAGCPSVGYTDLEAKAWYHDGVHYCIENGLMIGVEKDVFAPEGSMSRAALISVLWRMEGEPKVGHELSFKDVAEGAWYTEAVRWANAKGIINGYSAKKFGPDDALTREQIAAILYRYAAFKGEPSAISENKADGFADWNKVSGWAETAVAWACSEGLLAGKQTDGKLTLSPRDTATRAQTANIIYRYIEDI